jgi:hypothetical protein
VSILCVGSGEAKPICSELRATASLGGQSIMNFQSLTLGKRQVGLYPNLGY